MTFQEKLVILRKSKGLTQDDFASAVGVSRQAVYKWESGQSYPEVPKLLEMKMLFTISIDELLDDSYDLPVPEKKRKKRIPKEVKVEKPIVKAAPKAEPAVKPAPKAEPVVVAAPKAEPVAQPTPKAEPVVAAAPKAEPVAQPTPKAEPVAPKIDTVPAPTEEELAAITLEDLEADEPAKKGNFFERLFGRR